MPVDDFDALIEDVRPRLARAFVAAYGRQRGEEALGEAMAVAWERFINLATTRIRTILGSSMRRFTGTIVAIRSEVFTVMVANEKLYRHPYTRQSRLRYFFSREQEPCPSERESSRRGFRLSGFDRSKGNPGVWYRHIHALRLSARRLMGNLISTPLIVTIRNGSIY